MVLSWPFSYPPPSQVCTPLGPCLTLTRWSDLWGLPSLVSLRFKLSLLAMGVECEGTDVPYAAGKAWSIGYRWILYHDVGIIEGSHLLQVTGGHETALLGGRYK